MEKSLNRACKLIKIGNSRGVIIDKDTIEYLGLEIGCWIKLTIEKGDQQIS